MALAVIGLGSNLGSRRALLAAATALLREQPGLEVVARSALYATAAVGPPQPDFLNAALLVRWPGGAKALLDVLLFVEALLGRERNQRWGARTVDLDLLWWSEGEVVLPELAVPHPRLFERNFALAPLLDVLPAPDDALFSALRAVGGRPRRDAVGWLGRVVSLPNASPWLESYAEALAFALSHTTLPAHDVRPCRTQPFVVRSPEAAVLGRLAECTVAVGFMPVGAVVLETAPGFARGLWLGDYAEARGCRFASVHVEGGAAGAHRAHVELSLAR